MRGAGPGPAQRVDLNHHLVTLTVAPELIDIRSLELWELGAVGIEDVDGGVRAAFVDAASATAARDRWAPGSEIEIYDETFGIDTAAVPTDIVVAGRFTIHPPTHVLESDSIGIALDPGHAFGSGSHASTRLALELLGVHVAAGDRVADIGCGSGVLAVGAALLGAEVVAVDIDEHAVRATAANAARNGVADRIDVALGSIDAAVGVDIALINVTIDVHEDFADRGLALPARLIVAGMLDGPQVERCAVAYGAEITDRRSDGEWSGLLLARPAPST